MNLVKNIKIICLFILMAIILWNPTETCRYAFEGLTQWSTRMVPTLFPFMVLSSLMIYSGADKQLGKILSYILKPFLKLTDYGIYAATMGFLCGFPMGAKVVSELYIARKITAREAQLLIAFCNNIGTAYFLGLILPILHILGYHSTIPFLFGMYGIPFLYGVLLSYRYMNENKIPVTQQNTKTECMNSSTAELLSKVCMDNIQAILLLGGYVTFINAFRVIFDCLPMTHNMAAVLGCFLEIISGIPNIYSSGLIAASKMFWIMSCLSFNGISCMIQAGSFLEKAKLPVGHYILHKLILTGISMIYYFLLFKMLPH